MKAKPLAGQFNRLKRLSGGLLALSLVLGMTLAPTVPAWAAISQDERLAKLEVKFFKHTYPKDDDISRLERLEKMIFGEARNGTDDERLKNLAATVPNLNELPASAEAATASSSDSSASSASSSSPSPAADSDSSRSVADSTPAPTKKSSGKSGKHSTPVAATPIEDNAQETHKVLAGESKYPAVTALEEHLFKRDYASEPVGDRLNRLETKVFGRPSRFTDLSERVDALKEKTNVDIAKRPPAGADWTDEDDDSGRAFPVPARSEPIARTDGDDGKSFSGIDAAKDLNKAFGRGGNYFSTNGSPAGSYGMGGAGSRSSSNSASGAYGMGGGYSNPSNLAMAGSAPSSPSPSSSSSSRSSGGKKLGPRGNALPPSSDDAPSASSSSSRASSPAPDQDDAVADRAAANPLGLNQQVTQLETAVLGKNFGQEPMIDRVARLEKTVFPKEAQSTLPLPDRVARLSKKVPQASQTAMSGGRSGASRSGRSSSGSGSSYHRPSGWIDEDANIGTGSGSSSSSSFGSDSDESFATGSSGMSGLGSSLGLGGGMGSSMGSSMGSGAGAMAQQPQQKGGLSKIINSIGNALGGGSGFTGGYNVNSNNLRPDPASGMLVDTMTGNLINPTTGAVVGRSAAYSGNTMYNGGISTGMGLGGIGLGGMPMGGVGIGGLGMGGLGMGGLGMGGMGMGGLGMGGMGMPYGSVYGGMPMGGFNGFNNGFSPYGMGGVNPYGMMRPGIGVHF